MTSPITSQSGQRSKVSYGSNPSEEPSTSSGSQPKYFALRCHTAGDLITAYESADKEEDKEQCSYLREIAIEAVKQFESDTNAHDLNIEEISKLSVINNEEIYRAVANSLCAKAKKDAEAFLLAKPKNLECLARIMWCKHSILDTYDQNLPDKYLKLMLEHSEWDISFLEILSNFLDAMLHRGVEIKPKQAESIGKRLEELQKNAGKGPRADERKFKIQYLQQTILRMLSSKDRVQMAARQAFSFFMALVYVGGAGGSIAVAIISGGLAIPVAIPAVAESLLTSKDHVEKIRSSILGGKEAWFDTLNAQRERIFYVCRKKDYNADEIALLKKEFLLLQNNEIDLKIRFGIVKTLEQLAQFHPADYVRECCLNVLQFYWAEPKLSEMLLASVARLSVLVDQKHESWFHDFFDHLDQSQKDKYKQLRQKFQAQPSPVHPQTNIIKLAQLKVDSRPTPKEKPGSSKVHTIADSSLSDFSSPNSDAMQVKDHIRKQAEKRDCNRTSRILFVNKSRYFLEFKDCKDDSGYFLSDAKAAFAYRTEVPYFEDNREKGKIEFLHTLPKGYTGGIVHTKRAHTACGSVGYVRFKVVATEEGKNYIVCCGFSTVYSGINSAGVEIRGENGSTDGNRISEHGVDPTGVVSNVDKLCSSPHAA
ncbi:MAG: hypothetical protein V4591_05155, partial [Bdellovibrionota bacterium]